MDEPITKLLEFTPGFGMDAYIGPPYQFSATTRRIEVPERVAVHLTKSFPRNFKVVGVVSEDSDFKEDELEPVLVEPSKARIRGASGEVFEIDDLMDETKTPLIKLRGMARDLLEPGQRLPRNRAGLAQFIFEHSSTDSTVATTTVPKPETEQNKPTGKRR